MDIRTILETLREPRRPNLLLELERIRSHPVVQAFADTQADMVATDQEADFSRDIESNRSALRDFMGILKQQGFTPVGSGVCGAVFTHPSLAYVVKLFGNDRAYLAFLRYALANQSNPHVPKFRGKLTRVTPTINSVRMEKLHRIDSGSPHDSEWYSKWICLLLFAKDKTATPDEYMEEMGEIVASRNHFNHDRARIFVSFMAKQPGLLDVLDKMKRSGITIDLHDGNLMKRPDGTWVIIDPFFTDDSEGQAAIADAWMKG